MRMAERGLVNFGRCSPNRRLDDCTCDLEAAAKLSRSYLSPCDHKPQSPSFRISSNETQGMKMRNAHSGVFHQYSAFRVPQSAFPIPHFPGSENSRFSFVIQAKPVEDIVLPIGGGIL